MFRTRARSHLVILAGALVCLAACDKKDEEFGTLVVPFELGNDRDCDSFDVETVVGELESEDEEYKYMDSVKCESGQVRFQSIPAGTYRLRLYGYDNDDVAVMDNLESNQLTVSVIGETTVVANRPVKLTSAPAHLYLRWSFGFGTCKSAGIESFLVEVWRSDGSDLLLDAELECEDVGEEEGNYREVPDERRALAGDEVGEVSVQPIDRGGDEIGDAVTFSFHAPGPGRKIYLSVQCEDDVCEGTLDDD